jgi:hypothetical protein
MAFLLGFIFDPEDGGRMFLRNFSSLSAGYGITFEKLALFIKNITGTAHFT